jgi:hypothetical protein
MLFPILRFRAKGKIPLGEEFPFASPWCASHDAGL